MEQALISPYDINTDGKTPIVLTADIVVAPEDFEKAGEKPAKLPLDRLGVTLNLSWYGPTAHYVFSRFEIGNGRDFAKKGEGDNSDIRDIDLATRLCGHVADRLLRLARSSRSNVTRRSDDPPLDKRERDILNVVARFQFAHAEYAPATEVPLSFPPDAAASVELAVDGLLKKGYLDRRHETLGLTPAGLLACAWAEEAAGGAKDLLDYLKYRAEAERSRFTHFTWSDLTAANVAGAGDSEYAFMRALIAILRIEGSMSTWWGGRGGPFGRAPTRLPS
jgi:hypothetical protein